MDHLSSVMESHAIDPARRKSEILQDLESGAELDLVPRDRLGDGLIAMIIAANLARAGFRVRVWHQQLATLNGWFPNFQVLPRDQASGFSSELGIHQRSDTLEGGPKTTRVHVIGDSIPRTRGHRAELYRHWIQDALGLEQATLDLDSRPPLGVEPGKHPNRIVLHPMSANLRRSWPAKRYLELGEALTRRGWTVTFVMHSSDEQQWLDQSAARFPHRAFLNLADLASFFAESRLFVGNDSGPGHLASAMGIPTVTIAARESQARRWRPCWSPSALVVPTFFLPGARLQFATWHLFSPVRNAVDVVERLIGDTE